MKLRIWLRDGKQVVWVKEVDTMEDLGKLLMSASVAADGIEIKFGEDSIILVGRLGVEISVLPDEEEKVTLSGRSPESESAPGAPAGIDAETGMHRDYWVLSEEERGKGFVRPVRNSYLHKTCGVVTTMTRAIAETYARKPEFYSSTFCCRCKQHYPVGEFCWSGTDEVVGS